MLTAAELLAAAARLVDEGELAAAETLARQVLAEDPDSIGALHVLGVVARMTNRPALAVELLKKAIECGGRVAAIFFELGVASKMDGQFDAAIRAFEQVIEIDPKFQSAYVNLGAVLERQERFAEALPHCRKAVELQGDCGLARFNLANTLWVLGQVEEACREFEAAVKLDPSYAKAHWNSACCHLLAGKFDIGWREYEWREAAEEVSLDKYSQPRWRGEPLAGKCILVHGEQGIGDEILFASCLPELIAQAGQCVVVCDPRLARLFARSFPAAVIHGEARRKDLAPASVPEKIDVQTPAGSVPQFLRPTRESFPRRQSFLLADPAARRHWRQRFDALGAGLKVGISWRAGGQPSERRKRTTTLDQWRGLLATPGVQWINLQYGETAEETDQCRRDQGVQIHDLPEADPLVDLDSFAAKVAALDLVISVGNATVHMAGALGVPAWNLLPQVPGWRWGATGEQNLWYPSVRLFRQHERGEWEPVFQRVAGMLRELVGEKSASGSQRETASAVGSGAESSARSTERLTVPPVPVLTRLTDVSTITQQAAERHRAGDLPRAEALAREVLAHAPRNVNALHLLGTIARQTRRFDLAIRSLSQAVAVWDKDAGIHLNLAGALHEAGRLEEAVSAYRRALELKPDLIEAQLGLGNALIALQRTPEAVSCFESAVKNQPNSFKAHNALGCALLAQEQWLAAEAAFRTAVKLQPQYMAAHNNLGRALQQQQRLDEAIACFQRALDLDETCLPAIVNLAQAFHGQEQRETAARLYRRALKRRPDHPNALVGLARVEQELATTLGN